MMGTNVYETLPNYILEHLDLNKHCIGSNISVNIYENNYYFVQNNENELIDIEYNNNNNDNYNNYSYKEEKKCKKRKLDDDYVNIISNKKKKKIIHENNIDNKNEEDNEEKKEKNKYEILNKYEFISLLSKHLPIDKKEKTSSLGEKNEIRKNHIKFIMNKIYDLIENSKLPITTNITNSYEIKKLYYIIQTFNIFIQENMENKIEKDPYKPPKHIKNLIISQCIDDTNGKEAENYFKRFLNTMSEARRILDQQFEKQVCYHKFNRKRKEKSDRKRE